MPTDLVQQYESALHSHHKQTLQSLAPALLAKGLKAPLAVLYDLLQAHYGHQEDWWPATDAYEIMVGAILTQNTAWTNVEKALANFGDSLSPDAILSLSDEALEATIRPAGFFRQKTQYLKNISAWFRDRGGSPSAILAHFELYDETMQAPLTREELVRRAIQGLRPELLAIKGVGPETADTILLYALGLPSFVIDAYTKRLCSRLPIDIGKTYATAKLAFEAQGPQGVGAYKEYHAYIVIHGKDFCKKRNPSCEACPLRTICQRVGVA